MSGALKEVRNRIKSVQSTQQITKAMKMVSAAKLRRAQDAAQEGDGCGEPGAVRLAEDAVRAGDGVARPGEISAGLFRGIGARLDIGIGEFAET